MTKIIENKNCTVENVLKIKHYCCAKILYYMFKRTPGVWELYTVEITRVNNMIYWEMTCQIN